jgi:glycosyltransferase involved in cell wall biosynthesis
MEPCNIICFANDWTGDPLSKKQVMRRLAQKHKILWINSVNNRRPQLAGKDLRRILQKIAEFRRGLTKVEEQIWVLTPLYLPFHGVRLVRAANRKLLGWQIRRAARRLGLAEPITWTFLPNTADVVGNLGERCIVYHCVDEYAAFSDAGSEVRFREQELLEKSNLVIVCSDYLKEGKRRLNAHTHLVTHGVDFAHFSRAATESTSIPSELRELPRPILGFHGLLADWVDLKIIREIASLRANWSIVLVGRADTNLSPIENISNICVLGHRPYERLPEYLHAFDVAILPFVCNELTFNSNPLKLREYLAAGLPVISAPLPEAAKFGDRLTLASTAQEYVDAIERLLAKGETGPSLARSLQMEKESWDHKVAEMETLLAAALGEKNGAPSEAHRIENDPDSAWKYQCER